MVKKIENSIQKILRENWGIILSIIVFIIWIVRLEARIVKVETDQFLMYRNYKEERQEIKELAKSLTETTQELRIAVTELRTQLKVFMKKK